MDTQAYILVLWLTLVFTNLSKVNGNAEGDALIAFKKQLVDPENNLISWKNNILGPCNWEFVTCNYNKSVTRLDLGNTNLSGKLVPQLGQLTNLEFLELFANHFVGNIPDELGNLTNLISINLCHNQLSGDIPDTLGNLHKLQFLYLCKNTLTGTIPVSLTTITTLEFLDVSHNNLSGDFLVNGSFSQLRYFNFNGNPNLRARSKASNTRSNKKIVVGGAIAGGATLLLLVGGAVALALRLGRKPEDEFFDVPAKEDIEIELGQLKKFTLSELLIATDSFNNQHILGRGGSGVVYKGRLADGTFVAIKRLHTCGGLQLQTELEIISTTMHRNILRLTGYCTTPSAWFLIYPYMANGSLASWLKGRPSTRNNPLNWTIRKQIALGSAKGLAYLHHHCDSKIIHRDVKAGNILLDEDFQAVVGDFGLAKLIDYKDSHVTTAVRGTIGYLAPEYQSTGKCSEKTDVFGYGVVLLELITGHSAIDLARGANDDDLELRDWVIREVYRKNKLERLVDVELKGDYTIDEMEQMIKVALLCIQATPLERPNMSEVVRMFEEGDDDGLDKKWEKFQKEEAIDKKNMLGMKNIMDRMINPMKNIIEDISNSDPSSQDSIYELPSSSI